MNNSLAILAQGLDKKIEVLKKIQAYNDAQEQSFLNGEADLDTFDQAIEEKDQLIEELLRLDDGFEAMYANLARELEANKAQYAPQISGLQERIRTITELSNSIQIKEARNKKLVEDYFAKRRGEIKQGRQQSRAVYNYYKSMSGGGLPGSSMWDTKQ